MSPADWRKAYAPTRVYNPQAHTAGGRRKDLGMFMRSSTEANVARLFRWMGIPWEYEPQEFSFPVERGIRFYTPDFRITIPVSRPRGKSVLEQWPRMLADLEPGTYWIEVKGWMDQGSRTRITRFCDYYPEEAKKLVVITRAPGKSRYRWGERMNKKLDAAGVQLVDVTPLLALGAMLQLEGWEARRK